MSNSTKEIIKKVRKIEIKTRRLSDHIFSGEYHSSFKGRGMTFSEVRKYEYGDDIRAIDWNVTAKLNEPHIKVFEEERELTMMLMVDVSSSGLFGTENQLKKDMITEISATLSFSAMQNNDKVGLILFSDDIELFIPPKKGKGHILRIIRELIEFKPKSNKTNIGEALEYLSRVLKKKAIVFLISDFLDTNYKDSLKISAKRHDLTGIRIFDKNEQELPNIGIVNMKEAETGELFTIDTSSKKLKEIYKQKYLEYIKYFENSFKKSSAGYLKNSTSQDYVISLLSYFKKR